MLRLATLSLLALSTGACAITGPDDGTGAVASTVDGGWETWGIDFTAGTYGGLEPRPRIQLAAFVVMNGVTSWDNHDGADHVIE